MYCVCVKAIMAAVLYDHSMVSIGKRTSVDLASCSFLQSAAVFN